MTAMYDAIIMIDFLSYDSLAKLYVHFRQYSQISLRFA